MGEVLDFSRPGMPPRPEGDLDVVIHQEELEELQILRRRWGELTRELRSKGDSVLWRLLNNHPVEPGSLTATALRMPSSCYSVTRSSYWMVKVK